MLTTAQQLMMAQAQQYDLLTLSGNEVTDYIRTLPDQGDGLTNDGSFGVWPAATNRAINSNAKTSGTDDIIDVGATTSRVASGLVGADTTHFSTVTANAATAEGTSQLISGGAAGTQYTFSVWLAGTGTVKLYISDSVSGKQLGAQITLTATPTKYSVTATTGAASTTQTVGWETDSQQAITVTHGRWMAQTGAVATPHVLTDGATAASSAARIQIPDVARLFTPSQGWMTYRIRAGHAIGTAPFENSYYFQHRTDTNSRMELYSIASTSLLAFARVGLPGPDGRIVTVAAPFILGDVFTVTVTWTEDTLYISYNGGAFSSLACPFVPIGLPVNSDLGTDGSGTQVISSDILWFVCGKGFLANSDAAYLHSLGNAGPPRLTGLPGHPTALWDATSGVFTRRR